MKIWNYNEKHTRDNIVDFLDIFRESKELDLSNDDALAALLVFLREQYLLSEIEDARRYLTDEEKEREDFGLVEQLIVYKKHLTSKHKYSNTDVTCFTRDFKKFYFWFHSYAELAETSRLVKEILCKERKAA